MSFFDRIKKKPASDPPADPWPQPPTADTMCLALMDRGLGEIEPAAGLLKSAFGEQAVGENDRLHPRIPAFTAMLDGLEFAEQRRLVLLWGVAADESGIGGKNEGIQDKNMAARSNRYGWQHDTFWRQYFRL